MKKHYIFTIVAISLILLLASCTNNLVDTLSIVDLQAGDKVVFTYYSGTQTIGQIIVNDTDSGIDVSGYGKIEIKFDEKTPSRNSDGSVVYPFTLKEIKYYIQIDSLGQITIMDNDFQKKQIMIISCLYDTNEDYNPETFNIEFKQ